MGPLEGRCPVRRLDLFRNRLDVEGTDEAPGGTPWRLTGALEFNPSEFSRIRLQYNHDRSDPDASPNDEWFLQFILGIGAHAAHQF